jgi:predicted amidohydrolase YtcJ
MLPALRWPWAQRRKRNSAAVLHVDFLLPGFNDSHVHLRGRSPREIDMKQAKPIADIQRLVREKAKRLVGAPDD